MTSTVTISCPDGIVLGADTRITHISEGRWVCYEDNVRKVFPFRAIPVGASYWGLAQIDQKPMLDILSEFDKEVKPSDDVNSVSDKLVQYLRQYSNRIDRRMGIHVAGYCHGAEGAYPQIRHIFHMDYHDTGQFTNEDSNVEEHSVKDGERSSHPYLPYVAVFNGDYTVASALFHYLPFLRQNRRRLVLPDLLNLEECIELVKFLIESSARLLPLVCEVSHGIARKVPQTVSGMTIATITKTNGFKFVM